MASHGTHQVLREGNMLMVKLVGSFNEVGVQAYIDTVKANINSFGGEPFAMLVNDQEVEGGTPEAYQLLNEYNDWLNSQAVAAKAFVLNSMALRHILLERTPALKQQNIAFFPDNESAKDWLIHQL